MKVTTVMIASVALIAMPAFGEMPGKGWISRDKVAQIMKHRGYQVTKLEADDGHWEGKMTKAGQKYEFHVDPLTGRITKLEREDG